ncbi:hypothetical protein M885DRAFT_537079 [Pelagophyceae sp. CCMP2097]|nr:hypothetical protein M885DRAFT_537079 [Pelagophyceae sp. CCMP2097]
MLRALVLCVGCVAAWSPVLKTAGRRSVVVHGGRAATPLGRTTTREGKAQRVTEISEMVSQAEAMFCIQGSGLTVKAIFNLRKTLPEGSTCVTIKNTLLKVAAKDLGWDAAAVTSAHDMLENPNLWVLVGEDAKGTIDSYKAWLKAFQLNKDETYAIKGGFAEGGYLDSKGVGSFIDLPTKTELMQALAASINEAGSLGIAKGLKNSKASARGIAVRLNSAAGNKLTTAIKISVGDETINPN